MYADHRAGTLPVEVQIADVEFPPCLFQAGAVSAIHRSSQAKLGAVGDVDGIVIILRPDHRQYRPEDFLLGDARVRRYVAKDRRLDEVSTLRRFPGLAAKQQSALLRTDLDIVHDR